MIKQLKRLHERMTVATTLSIGRGDASHGDREASQNRSERPAEAVPPYTETELSDDTVDRIEGWVENTTLQAVDDRHVLANLDEILLIFVGIRGQATGKELSTDLRRVFGTDLSSGTVYPRLTALEEQELLAVREFPRRKVYSLREPATVCDRIKSDAERTLAFSMTLQTLAIECVDEHSNHPYRESTHE